MSVLVSRHVDDVLENLSTHADATILAGGTDLLVEINFGRQRPSHIVSIDRIADGKIVETWTNWDFWGLMEQLGVVSLPRPGA